MCRKVWALLFVKVEMVSTIYIAASLQTCTVLNNEHFLTYFCSLCYFWRFCVPWNPYKNTVTEVQTFSGWMFLSYSVRAILMTSNRKLLLLHLKFTIQFAVLLSQFSFLSVFVYRSPRYSIFSLSESIIFSSVRWVSKVRAQGLITELQWWQLPVPHVL